MVSIVVKRQRMRGERLSPTSLVVPEQRYSETWSCAKSQAIRR
jgi:hypothetical protein